MSITKNYDNSETKRNRLKRELRKRCKENGGEFYIKSKFLTEDTGLTPKEMGALFVQIDKKDNDFEIEKWSYTSATTWRIQLIEGES